MKRRKFLQMMGLVPAALVLGQTIQANPIPKKLVKSTMTGNPDAKLISYAAEGDYGLDVGQVLMHNGEGPEWADLVDTSDIPRDLGSQSKRWNNAYFKGNK